VEDARNGEGAVGDLVERFELEEWVDENQDKIRDTISNFGAPAIDVVRRVFATIFAAITIVVLTILMVLESPKFSATILGMLPDRHRERVRGVAVDSCRAVSGYVFGNLLISVIAGLSAYTTLKLLGVPYAEVLGLFVAFSDLIPLVGATLGAVPSTLFAFLHSVTAGVVALIFFIVYQQFENHVLQVTIMSRTVKLNALTVFISVLVGIELLGILGALLAIPVAGVIQVITRDFWDERKGRPTSQPTVGVDHVPVTEPGK
jgi:predicted PurR-regulated permease PerM